MLADSVISTLIGYGWVSTAEQNPTHQIDALARAERDIYLDTASGRSPRTRSETWSHLKIASTAKVA